MPRSHLKPQVEGFFLAALTALALDCSPKEPQSEAAPGTPARCQEANPERDTARYVLEVHCGLCHRQDSPGAQSRALAVFNLNEMEWARSLDARQLGDMVIRFQENAATQETEDVKVIQRFVEAELARRDCR